MVVSSLLTEAGFESAEKAAVETLTEMLQSCEHPASSARQSHAGAACFSAFKLVFALWGFVFPFLLSSVSDVSKRRRRDGWRECSTGVTGSCERKVLV